MKTTAKAMPKLTRKQAAFVRHLIDNPKDSATKAALAAYNVTTPHSAEVVAHETMRNPEVISALANYSDLAESTLATTVSDWGRSDRPRQREIAQNAAMYIHDKVHGKATQRVETHSTGVNISIDLTGMMLDNHEEEEGKG